MDQKRVPIYVISDDSDDESSSSRPSTDDQDSHEGRRVLRKKPSIDDKQKKPSINDQKGFPRAKKQKLDTQHEEPKRDYILTTLEGVAFQSRLPHDKMTTAEKVAFPGVDHRIYLDIRNRVLQVIIYTSIGMMSILAFMSFKIWFNNLKCQLTVNNIVSNIEKPFDVELALIKRIFLFLDRYGYINFGVFQKLEKIHAKRKERIIVIGAGRFQVNP